MTCRFINNFLISCLFICYFCCQISIGQQQEKTRFAWPRWEERTIDCLSSNGTDCTLVARNAKKIRDPKLYKCRHEPMPQTKWNHLARKSKTRLACPIGCEPDADLSVIVKTPRDNPHCQKYYTYGKYRDTQLNEWFLWIAEPCIATLTTWCRFKDIFVD